MMLCPPALPDKVPSLETLLRLGRARGLLDRTVSPVLPDKISSFESLFREGQHRGPKDRRLLSQSVPPGLV